MMLNDPTRLQEDVLSFLLASYQNPLSIFDRVLIRALTYF